MYHPDARGGATSERMTAINDAWRVLSDPGRRASYDASRRPGGEVPERPAGGGERVVPAPQRLEPPRFPWRGLLALGVLGGTFVVVLSVLQRPAGPPAVDNVLQPGSCVVIESNGDAREVRCDAEHDGVVRFLVPFDGRCPSGTDTHRDRQGMGLACVTPTP